MRDLRGLWNGTAGALRLFPPQVTKLYPLSASKAALEEEARRTSKQTTPWGEVEISRTYYGTPERPSPTGQGIATQQAVAAVTELLSLSSAMSNQ